MTWSPMLKRMRQADPTHVASRPFVIADHTKALSCLCDDVSRDLCSDLLRSSCTSRPGHPITYVASSPQAGPVCPHA
jgi:hypothetical protein